MKLNSKNIKNIKKALLSLTKKRQFLPTLILIIATLIIVIIGYQLNTKNALDKKVKENSWKTQKSVFVPLSITDFSPKSGPTAGGNKLTITGKGLTKDAQIYIGSAGNINQRSTRLTLTKITATEATAVLPPHSPDNVDIYVVYEGNTIKASGQYSYTGSVVTSTSGVQLNTIEPPVVSIKNPGQITITGSGFAPTNTIAFGKGSISNIKSEDGKTIILTIPTMLDVPNLGLMPLAKTKYDLSVISQGKESNFITLTVSE